MSVLAVYKGKVYDSVDDLLLDIGKINEKSIYMTFGDLTILIPTEKETITEPEVIVEEIAKNERPGNPNCGLKSGMMNWCPRKKRCVDHKGIEYESYKARARAYGLEDSTVRSRLKSGMSLKAALETKPKIIFKKKVV